MSDSCTMRKGEARKLKPKVISEAQKVAGCGSRKEESRYNRTKPEAVETRSSTMEGRRVCKPGRATCDDRSCGHRKEAPVGGVWIRSARKVNRKRAKEAQSDRAGRGATLGRAECSMHGAAWYFGESARARAGRRTEMGRVQKAGGEGYPKRKGGVKCNMYEKVEQQKEG